MVSPIHASEGLRWPIPDFGMPDFANGRRSISAQNIARDPDAVHSQPGMKIVKAIHGQRSQARMELFQRRHPPLADGEKLSVKVATRFLKAIDAVVAVERAGQ